VDIEALKLYGFQQVLKAECTVFNAGCNEYVFLLNSEKEFDADLSCRFREKHTLYSEKCRHQAEG